MCIPISTEYGAREYFVSTNAIQALSNKTLIDPSIQVNETITTTETLTDPDTGEPILDPDTQEPQQITNVSNIPHDVILPPLGGTLATESQVNALTTRMNGSTQGYVFDTVAAMNTWLANSANTATLTVGTNLYIKDLSVPDYWWDGTSASELETGKVILQDYITSGDLTSYATKTGNEELSNKRLVNPVVSGSLYYNYVFPMVRIWIMYVSSEAKWKYRVRSALNPTENADYFSVIDYIELKNTDDSVIIHEILNYSIPISSYGISNWIPFSDEFQSRVHKGDRYIFSIHLSSPLSLYIA